MNKVFALVSCLLLGASLGLAITITDGGGTVDFSASNGAGLSADATFTLSGGMLTIVLTNTGSPASVPADGLTGLFWNSATTLSTTGASATLTGGSSLLNCTAGNGCTADTNVGGEFAYNAGSPSFPSFFNQGISSSGFGIFGSGNLNGPNLEDPVAVDGINFALVNGLAANANAGITGVPTIDNSVTFVFKNVTGPLDINPIGFQYGTALTETLICPDCGQGFVPEPSHLGLLIFATGLVAFVHWRRQRNAA